MVGAEGISLKPVNGNMKLKSTEKEASKGFAELISKLHTEAGSNREGKTNTEDASLANSKIADALKQRFVNRELVTKTKDNNVITLPVEPNPVEPNPEVASPETNDSTQTEEPLNVFSGESMGTEGLRETVYAVHGQQEQSSNKSITEANSSAIEANSSKAVAIAATVVEEMPKKTITGTSNESKVIGNALSEHDLTFAKTVSDEGKLVKQQSQTIEQIVEKVQSLNDLDQNLAKKTITPSQPMPSQDAATTNANKVLDGMQFLSMQQQVTEVSVKTSEAQMNEKQMPQVRASHLAEDLKGLFKQQITHFQNKEKSQIRVLLNPEHLGQLDILISEKQGKMHAQLLTTTGAAKDALEMQLHVLKMTLTNQGISVDKIEVTQQNSQMQDSMQNQSDAKQQKQQFEEQQQKQPKRFDKQQGYEGNEDYNVTLESKYEQREYNGQVNYVV